MGNTKLVVCGPQSAIEESGLLSHPGCTVVAGVESFAEHKDAAMFINLNEDAPDLHYKTAAPVLMNSVLNTLPAGSTGLYRINGWPGFLKRELWEISGPKDEIVSETLAAFGKKVVWVKDEPGLVSARVIAMIINEAFFALESKVSTREDIDTAMKLGTGYPFGPFEWANQIGQNRIGKLLQLLALSDKRYEPSILLTGDVDHP